MSKTFLEFFFTHLSNRISLLHTFYDLSVGVAINSLLFPRKTSSKEEFSGSFVHLESRHVTYKLGFSSMKEIAEMTSG